MNKHGGNLRRVLTQHSSGLKRREKVKRLSEGTMSSHGEDDELYRRKFRLPKKDLWDSIPVHPAAVPRKLRSAISKRSCRSASVPVTDSRRLKHSSNGGAVSLRTDFLKKMKTKAYTSEPLSNEEEEVAETLFALAGMITSSGESSKDQTPDCTRNDHDDPISSSKDVVIREEERGTACDQSTSCAADNAIPTADGSKRDPQQAEPMREKSPFNLPKLSERRQLNHDLKVSVPLVHHQSMPPLRACDEKLVTKSATASQMLSDTIWHKGFNATTTEKPAIPLWQPEHFVNSQAMEKVSSQGSGRSSATAFPSWVNATASSSRSGTCGDSVSVDKVSSSVDALDGTMEFRKRCMTHVYISHQIQGSENCKAEDTQPLNACQLQPSQSSFIAPHKNELKEGLTKQNFDFLSLTSGGALRANSQGNCLEAKGQVLHLHSGSQACSASLPCSTSSNFPSKAYRDQVAVASLAMPRAPPQVQLQLPQYFAGTFNAAHMSQTGPAKPSQLAQPNMLHSHQIQLPQQHQHPHPHQHQHPHPHQHQQQLQFSQQHQQLQQQQLQLPQQQQVQLQHQQHHQQQQIWSSQLAAQFRSGPQLPSHMANWQNRKQDFRISTQAWPTPSQSSREMPGPKYFHISQHTQQLIERCPPLPLSSAKPQPGQFQPESALPFQLLCNKQ